MGFSKRTNISVNFFLKSLLAAALVIGSIRLAMAATIVIPWSVSMTMPKEGFVAIHDLTKYTDPADGDQKLVIAQGWGQGAPIRFWDPRTQQLTTAFTAPLNTYQGRPYWRSVLPFKGKLYAGLGNQAHTLQTGPTYTGQVWQYNGHKWHVVLNTELSDTYTLGVYNKHLYAGLGAHGLQSAQLWVTSDGLNWRMLKQFSSDYVRTLAVFQNKLYIGLRDRADLWTYDGTTFEDIGPPPGFTPLLSQVKTLVVSPNRSLLYVGGVPAQIWTWDGSAYTLSLDATATDAEIYKGTIYKGDIFFPTHAKQNNGQSGHIYRFHHGTWTLDYSTPIGQAQLQVAHPFQGYIYAGGDGTPPDLLQALYTYQ